MSLGLVFLFVGVLFLGISARGVSDYTAFIVSRMTEAAPQLNPLWLKASFIFVLVGLSAKIGLAPMHPGDVDATSNAPAPVAALMAGSLRSTAVLVLLRFYQVVGRTDIQHFAQKLLIFAGLLSLAVSAIYIWRNRNYKRLLAYSSVEHLGIIAIGVGVGGVALLGALLHLLLTFLEKPRCFLWPGILAAATARVKSGLSPICCPACLGVPLSGGSRSFTSSERHRSEFFSVNSSSLEE